MTLALVIDTSAVIAILCDEPDAPALRQFMAQADVIIMPASVYLEAGMVLMQRRGDGARAILDDFLRFGQIDIAPLGATEAGLALEAFSRYGKGRGHKAQLNFGDCQSYAVAKARDLPLLFVGEDFAATDLVRVGALARDR